MDFINYDTNTHQYIPTRGTDGYNARLLRAIKERNKKHEIHSN